MASREGFTLGGLEPNHFGLDHEVHLNQRDHILGMVAQGAVLFGQKRELHAADTTSGRHHPVHVTSPDYIRPVLEIHTADRLAPLAEDLARLLQHSPADPLASEWIATPSKAMQRWLSLELAKTLGSGSGDGPANDGVSANIRFTYPGSLLGKVLEAALGDHNPWEIERLTWATFAALEGFDQYEVSRYGRARRIADLFDRYNLHRPEMIREWAAGHDTDGAGRPLPPHHIWQPTLWRRVRELVNVASPAEEMPQILDRLASGDLQPDLPGRLVMFGLTVIPGGPGFMELAGAVAVHHSLHLYLVEPAAHGVLTSEPGRLHPLLSSWARPSISTAQILSRSGHATQRIEAPVEEAPPDSILHTLQARIRSGTTPADHTDRADAFDLDGSVQIHSCFGNTRQVEALRDSILGLLADDPTLDEDDILVLTPTIETFAPLIEAVFGPSATQHDQAGPTSLRYRIADMSIRHSNPVLAAVASLLQMATGRFEVGTVVDFIGLAPVRDRFDLSSDDLATITSWAESTNVRWGLNPQHREHHGLPRSLTTNTWQAAVDQLLVGSTVISTDSSLAIGGVAAEGIEGSLTDLAAKLAEIIGGLADVAEATTDIRSIDDWVEFLIATQKSLLAAPRGQEWQVDNLMVILDGLVESASRGSGVVPTGLTFDDFRRAVSGRLEGSSGRPDFFRGGITITSMRPMRWIPHRVICLMGVDQSAFTNRSSDGDDLIALSPTLGDFDSQGESRQAMLEAVLAAGDNLLIFRNGHDVRTNVEIPRPTVLEELLDALVDGRPPELSADFRESFEIRHPRQVFDERYFTIDGILPGKVAGFDPNAFRGVVARRSREVIIPAVRPRPGPRGSPSLIELTDARSLLVNPARYHTDNVLQLRLPRATEPLSAMMPIAPSGLDRWTLGDNMIDAALARTDRSVPDLINRLAEFEARKGSLPPGGLGEAHRSAVGSVTREILDSAENLGVVRGSVSETAIDIELGDGSRLVGVTTIRLHHPNPGPALVSYSRWKAQHLAEIWFDLMCLVAAEPDTAWRAVTINPIDPREAKGVEAWIIEPREESPEDRRAGAISSIDTVVECLTATLADPIPLFPEVSRGFYIETHPQSDLAIPGTLGSTKGRSRFNITDKWLGSDYSSGDRTDPSNELLWGKYELNDLRNLPGDAAQMWADKLWGAIDDSIVITRAGVGS